MDSNGNNPRRLEFAREETEKKANAQGVCQLEQ